MELVPILFLWAGCIAAQEIRTVNVPEGDDALLPCSLNSGQSIDKFDWRKDNGEEVFTYKSVVKYFGNGLKGQSENFTGRVVFFQHELKSGNASIIIKNTRLADNGIYTCGLVERFRPVHVRLNVGAAREPYVQPKMHENAWSLLECRVQGVPTPEVEWRNSAGEVLAKRVPGIEDGHSVELQLNVTKSDSYTCVATQRDIHHQVNNTLPVRFPETSNPWMIICAVLLPVNACACVCFFAKRCHNKRKQSKSNSERSVDKKLVDKPE